MVTVSNSAQLNSALRSASAGEVIQLTSGTYSLNMKGVDAHGAVITEAEGATASFSKIDFRNMHNVTFDSVHFNLPTATKGIVIASSDGITIENSDINGSTAQGTRAVFINHSSDMALVGNHVEGFATQFQLSDIDGLTVQGNVMTNASWDAMISGNVHHATYADNDITLNIPKGRLHTDGMQFYENGGASLSDVNIVNNYINTQGRSHGIYMGNNYAHNGGGDAAFFRNVVIDHNTVITTNSLGIAVGETHGLDITNNSASGIRVRYNSTDVNIADNYVNHKTIASGDNWAPHSGHSSSWSETGTHVQSGSLPDMTYDPDPAADTFHFDAHMI
jgi:hypothetical protein